MSFGAVAGQYASARPAYPAELLADFVTAGLDVLEIGAGTGLLTAALDKADLSSLVATDVDVQMLSHLAHGLPDIPAAAARAERLPFPTGQFDLVVAGQAAHWFDLEPAAREISRVLRPGGSLALLWNHRLSDEPWVAEFERITFSHWVGSINREVTDEITATGCFGKFHMSRTTFDHRVDLERARGLVESFSHVSTLEPGEKARVIEEAVELLAGHIDSDGVVSIPYYCESYVAKSTEAP